jgi:hypothetical protein
LSQPSRGLRSPLLGPRWPCAWICGRSCGPAADSTALPRRSTLAAETRREVDNDSDADADDDMDEGEPKRTRSREMRAVASPRSRALAMFALCCVRLQHRWRTDLWILLGVRPPVHQSRRLGGDQASAHCRLCAWTERTMRSTALSFLVDPRTACLVPVSPSNAPLGVLLVGLHAHHRCRCTLSMLLQRFNANYHHDPSLSSGQRSRAHLSNVQAGADSLGPYR